MPQDLPTTGSHAKSQVELQHILDAVSDGLCGVDASGRITRCNNVLLEMAGSPEEEVVGTDLLGWLRPVEHEIKHPPPKLLSFHCTADCEPMQTAGHVFLRKDGTCFPVEYWWRPLPQPWERTEFIVTIRDISPMVQIAKAARRSEDRFRDLLASVPDVIWTSDRDGRTVYISPQVKEIFGYDEQEICSGGAEFWIERIHPEDSNCVIRAYHDLFDKRIGFDQEYRIRRKDETWIWLRDRSICTYEQD